MSGFSAAILAVSLLGLPAQEDLGKRLQTVFAREPVARDGAFRFNFPRRDLNVTVQGFKIHPAFGLNTWATFSPMEGHRSRFVMVMGDCVVTADELPKTQAKMLDNGLTITGVHNHIVGQEPQIMYMHFRGVGEPEELARKVKEVFATTGVPLGPPTATATQESPDWGKVEEILKVKGGRTGPVLSFSIRRKETIKDAGEKLVSVNGGASSLNFQMVEGGRAMVTSDFVLLSEEVEPFIKALHRNGIPVTALHNHMVFDEPRTFHLHIFAIGEPERLAKGIAEALDLTNSER